MRINAKANGLRYVDIGDGVTVPETIDITVSPDMPDDDVPYEVRLHLVAADGRLVCQTVTVEATDQSGPVTAEGLRGIPLAGLLRWGVREHARQQGRRFNPDPDVAKDGPTPEALRAAATVYRLAYALGEPPTKAVSVSLGLTYSTAARWVAKAREAGLLGATTQGRAGGVPAVED
jgi:hypothetical protein